MQTPTFCSDRSTSRFRSNVVLPACVLLSLAIVEFNFRAVGACENLLGPSSKSVVAKADDRDQTKQADTDQRPGQSATPRGRRVTITKLLSIDALEGRLPLILHPRTRGNQFFAIIVTDRVGEVSTAQLVTAPLTGGKVKPLGRFSLSKRVVSAGIGTAIHSFVTASCLDRQTYYAAIGGTKIIKFGLRDDRASTFVKSIGGPDEHISSMLIVGGKLFAGLRCGKLVCLPVMSGTVAPVFDRTDFEPRRDEKDTFDIPHLLHDAARNRLLFVVQTRITRLAELWQYELRSGKAKRLFRLGRVQTALTADLDGDTLRLSDTWVASWNMATGQREVVANYPLGDWPFTRKLWIPRMRQVVICQGAA